MSDPTTPPDLGYAGLALDRCGDARGDPGFIAAQEADVARRYALFFGDDVALREEGGLLFSADEADAMGAETPAIFLGRSLEGPVFAATLSVTPPHADDLRALATDGRLTGEALALAGCAKSLLSWHARHGFCSNCGSRTEFASGGWRRECPACGTHHFPRVDPVVIMLVTHEGRCLLGRQPRFRPGMWSCLAGFIEPGETLEEAARREIFEEAGVRLGAVGYAFSQPWPFPAQLMIGVTAEAFDDRLTIDEVELEEARWFSREEVAAMLEGRHEAGAFAPPPAAIAHHLLKLFVAGG
ncbi:NAD(+) diphosphatase [Hansschlegelia quercus]|uniref:NAD(+) diphosphatase n=1 Tax=Hansschlegelia quercus TaxID=2528245 RepID=A0A4Q9GH31_9HYPH|nr:NAD(+) diphosphatase [Hansschlegelia quercus]TBN48299.1 NAD(+) diphosphatase [Hansschlegelia quercus]